ncbi:hypothetical protein FQN54_006562 [Arachnomyces sp. PD_36]|nr:hypothetical protein FQN54_006562 [Arachnomyces sp. PD_36]
MFPSSSISLGAALLLLAKPAFSEFHPCPLLGPRFPAPTSLIDSPIIQSALDDLESQFNNTIATGNSSHGPTTPNATSFSVSLFSIAEGSSYSSDKPFFYEFHHTAPPIKSSSVGVQAVDADSIYRIGALSQIFCVWSLLIEAGDGHWHEPVTKYVPELADAVEDLVPSNSIEYVDWDQVTLGDLASHMAGIGRDYGFTDSLGGGYANDSDTSYTRDEFFEDFIHRAPVYLPGTTPIFSNAAFQILGYVVEAMAGDSFGSILEDRILAPLNMTGSSLSAPSESGKGVIPVDESASGWSAVLGDKSPSISMYSTVKDLARAGKAILASELLTPAETRRWLKPVTRTSNTANSVGRSWNIYTAVSESTDPVIDVYTQLGNTGLYSSYIGLSEDHGVGFSILAADVNSSADLNVHADLISESLLPALERAAMSQANASYSGVYSCAQDDSSITIEVDMEVGLSVTAWTNRGVDVRESLATSQGMKPSSLSIRLFPTNLITESESGSKRAFRAVFQNKDAFADSGTPTCITWMFVDEILNDSMAMDRFVFGLDSDGQATSLDVPALKATLERGG